MPDRKIIFICVLAFAAANLSLAANVFVQHNLVSDLPGVADVVDRCLVNPWGIVASPTSPFWISDNGTGLSTLYNGNGAATPLVVAIPGPNGAPAPAQTCGSSTLGPGAPTGTVFNDTASFLAGTAPASFIFATEQGVIVGWNGPSGQKGVVLADRSASGAVYKGLAIATRSEGPLLYAANFNAGTVDVFDGSMNMVTLPGAFTDPSIPAGFAPFNIKNLDGSLYVTYAKQDSLRHDDVAGSGNGYIDIYDLNGLLQRRLVSGGALNSPWGLAVAPAGFGEFGGAVLVGNFGDGTIHAFDPASGRLLGSLQDRTGKPIQISGLWGLTFGNGARANPGAAASGGEASLLYFTAGIAGPDTVESHGLLGAIGPAPAILPNGVLNAASFGAAVAPGAFASIFGSGLAATTRSWTNTDFVNGKLPTQLDGISVTVDGVPAYVYFVSPGQIDIIVPPDSAQGNVPVVVSNNGAVSASGTAKMQAVAPSLFVIGGKYAIVTHANGSLVGPAALFTAATSPAQPGETVLIYGTGFGPANPDQPGLVVAAPVPAAAVPTVTIGGQTAGVVSASLLVAGLYQINVTVPALPVGAAAMDFPVAISSGAFSSQANLFITVHAAQ
jgi:uncharacterized protein (TIGR03118 family)